MAMNMLRRLCSPGPKDLGNTEFARELRVMLFLGIKAEIYSSADTEELTNLLDSELVI